MKEEMAAIMGVFRGDRMREIRKRRGLSQEALADKLTETHERALPQQMVSLYERGDTDPSAETLVRIARALNVSVDYLLGLVDDPEDRLVYRATRSAALERLQWLIANGYVIEALEQFTSMTKREDDANLAGE